MELTFRIRRHAIICTAARGITSDLRTVFHDFSTGSFSNFTVLRRGTSKNKMHAIGTG